MMKTTRLGRRIAALAVAGVMMLGAAALAGSVDQPGGMSDRFQIFLGEPLTQDGASPYGEWRAIDRNTRLLSNGQAGFDARSIGYSGPAGISYFTPRLSDMDIGIGLSGRRAGGKAAGDLAGPTANANNWRFGGSFGTSTLRVGAAFGDHSDPACRDIESCKTNDFWDIGVAWRFGSGALSAGYTASLRRQPGVEESETLDIFSVSAGYRIAPGLDVFGGIDWIELPAADATQDRPRNTRFMLGTNLRF